MSPRENYAAKIAALLRQAEDPAATPQEAEAFTAKAETLMIKWGISDAEVDGRRKAQKKGQEKVVQKIIHIEGANARALIRIGFAIGQGLDVRVLKSSVRGKTMDQNLWLIGHESDVARAEMLYTSLALQALAAREVWWKDPETPERKLDANGKFLAKRQFIWSFADEVGRRLAATRKQVVEEAGSGTELVLVDRSKRVDEWVDANLKVGKGRSQNGSSGGRAAGRAAGAKARLDEKGVGNGRAGAIEK